MAKTKFLYAPSFNGRVMFDEIATSRRMKRARIRSKLRSSTGRITSKWGPEKTWLKHWNDQGAVIVKIQVGEIHSL